MRVTINPIHPGTVSDGSVESLSNATVFTPYRQKLHSQKCFACLDFFSPHPCSYLSSPPSSIVGNFQNSMTHHLTCRPRPRRHHNANTTDRKWSEVVVMWSVSDNGSLYTEWIYTAEVQRLKCFHLRVSTLLGWLCSDWLNEISGKHGETVNPTRLRRWWRWEGLGWE